MLQFISIGSGSSGNSYFLRADDYAIFIDMGVGVRIFNHLCQTYGIPQHLGRAILLTHDHADHTRAVGSYASRRHLPVYALEAVHQALLQNYIQGTKIPAALRHDILPESPFTLGPFTVTPFEVPHDSRACCGFHITAEGTTFTLMTDAGHVTPRMADYIRRSRYLVIEANHDAQMLRTGRYPIRLQRRIASPTGHLENAAAATALADHLSPEARHVWLCHLSQDNNRPEVALQTACNALTAAGFPVGNGLNVDVLPRRTPSSTFTLEVAD